MRLGMRRQATVSLLLILAVGNGVYIDAAFTDTTDYAGEPAFEINRFTIDGGDSAPEVGSSCPGPSDSPTPASSAAADSRWPVGSGFRSPTATAIPTGASI